MFDFEWMFLTGRFSFSLLLRNLPGIKEDPAGGWEESIRLSACVLVVEPDWTGLTVGNRNRQVLKGISGVTLIYQECAQRKKFQSVWNPNPTIWFAPPTYFIMHAQSPQWRYWIVTAPPRIRQMPGAVPYGHSDRFMSHPADQAFFLHLLRDKERRTVGSETIANLVETSYERNFFELSLHMKTVHQEWVKAHPPTSEQYDAALRQLTLVQPRIPP
jgi:hypothetical protein